MRVFRRSRLTCFLILIVTMLMAVRTIVYLNADGGVQVRARRPADGNLKRKQLPAATPRTTPATEEGEIDSQFVENTGTVRRSHAGPYDHEPRPLFIAVKTGHTYHHTRIPVLLQTWFNYAPNEVSCYRVISMGHECNMISWYCIY